MTREQLIHNATMEIMSTIGIQFHNAKAIEILKANGIRVEDTTAFFTEEQVMHWVKKAPSTFTIHGRNPKYDTVIGGDKVNPAPTYGCAFIDEWDGTRRMGTMEDYKKCLKLVYAEDTYTINGGIVVQPSDVAIETSALQMFYATLLHSDKALLLPTGYKAEMEAMMEASCAVFGGKEAMIEKPRMVALINTISPLTLDERMLDCLMALAEYGQAVILCPAAMLGATSPINMAGTLASGAAESLAGIALAQMIRAGSPVVFGVQSTAADMKQGVTFACAAPEGTLMQGFGANLARFYDLPSRGGGCQTDAPHVNCQAGYESMLTFSSAYRHGINLVLEAGGVMDSVNATSFEKMVIDFEIMRQVIVSFTPIEVNDDTLSLQAIRDIGHDGSFLTHMNTLMNYGKTYVPKVGSRTANSEHYFKESIDMEMARLLDKYEKTKPVLEPDVQAKVKAILAQAGVSEADFAKAES